jgi:hypothetical protein
MRMLELGKSLEVELRTPNGTSGRTSKKFIDQKFSIRKSNEIRSPPPDKLGS